MPDKSGLPKYLWHYTKADTFEKILESKTLFLSRSDSTNDKLDSQKYIELIKEMINYPGANKKVTTEYNKRFPYQNVRYIACFSSLKDDVSQWDRYADSGQGVALCFEGGVNSRKSINNCTKALPFYVTIDKCHYVETLTDIKRLSRKSTFTLTKALRTLAEQKDGMEDYSILHEKGLKTVQEFIEHVYYNSAVFKHKSFRSEKEYRIYNLDKPSNISNNHFEIEICDKSGLNLIGVMLGPRCELSIGLAKELLTKREFFSTEVSKSNSPFFHNGTLLE